MIFRLEYANVIANLIERRSSSVFAYFSLEENKSYAYEFIEEFENLIFTNSPDSYRPLIGELKKSFENTYAQIDRENNLEIQYNLNYLFASIDNLSKALSKFKYRFLILDSFDYNKSPEILRQLKNIMEDSAIYLWSTDIGENYISLKDVFPGIEKAIDGRDRWPGVLIWEKKRKRCDEEKGSVFIPIKSSNEIVEIALNVQEHGDSFIEFLSLEAKKQKEQEINQYIIQLSDLHIGKGNTLKKTRLILDEIETKISELENNADITMFVTGDCIDSPNRLFLDQYVSFRRQLSSKVNRFYDVLGNHDVKDSGFLVPKDKMLVKEIYEKIGRDKIVYLSNDIIVLLFDSNNCTHSAKGQITDEQMSFFKNELIKIPDIKNKAIIAVLHHHVIPTPNLVWRRETLGQHILSPILVLKDAVKFKKWVKENHIKLILNGHKHTPYFYDAKAEGYKIISCGSTGGFTKIKGNNYECFNFIKINGNKITVKMIGVNETARYSNLIESFLVTI